MSKLRIILIIIFSFLAVSLFGQYQFDSTEIKKIRLIIEDNQYLKAENDSLESKVKLQDRKIFILNSQIAMRDTVIYFKEMQIRDLGVRPALDNSGIKWYTWAGVIISSIAGGIILQTILQK